MNAGATGTPPACVFQNVLAFGASVTQGTPRTMWPVYSAFVGSVEAYGRVMGTKILPGTYKSPLETYSARGYGTSPVRYLIKRYAGREGLKRVSYIGKYFVQSEADLGSTQIISLLAGADRSKFDSASLLIGVDAFYWDAIYQNCGYGNGTGTEALIPAFIAETKRLGKTLVLGTVPLENPATVRIDSERIGIPGLWYAPDSKCASSINKTLAQFCTVANNCYIADLKSAVEDLQCGKKLKLRNGEEFSLYEMRPDGVHMSDKGARYVADIVSLALEASPPACANP